MARLLVVVLISFFLFSIAGATLTRKILAAEIAATKNPTKLLIPSGKNQTMLIADGKNQTKLISDGKNRTKLLTDDGKNKTKLLAASGKNTTKLLAAAGKNQTSLLTTAGTNQTTLLLKSPAAKTNSTVLAKPVNSAKINSTKLTKPVNSTAKAKASNSTKLAKPISSATSKAPNPPSEFKSSRSGAWFIEDLVDEDQEESDLVAEFRDLPSRFHETLLPDLAKISSTSKTYLTKASKKITSGVKPIVGRRYAGAVAAATSAAAFIILPLLLLVGILRHVRHYLSLQRIIIFAQAYLAIYFAVLFLAAVVTGLEPLRIFYAASKAGYMCTQMIQAVCYVVFLLLQMVQLLVAPARATALPQAAVAVAVGLHYYMAVFHRAVAGEAPKTSWRAHALYAACFLVLLGLSRVADRRKKSYLAGAGDDDGKKS